MEAWWVNTQPSETFYSCNKSDLPLTQWWKWPTVQNLENILRILNLPHILPKRWIFEQILPKPSSFKVSFLKLESRNQDPSGKFSSLISNILHCSGQIWLALLSIQQAWPDRVLGEFTQICHHTSQITMDHLKFWPENWGGTSSWASATNWNYMLWWKILWRE